MSISFKYLICIMCFHFINMLMFQIFNDPFCTIKTIIQMCKDSVDIQLRNSSDLSSIISDLDYSTDVLIQIGLFSMACCKNNDCKY